ncbi:MAG: phosphate acyltransferase PlsX [Mycoplasmatales bacterium]
MNKIGIDIMGGDNAPIAPMNAAIKFANDNKDIEIHGYGTKEVFENIQLPLNFIKCIITEVITNDEEPAMAVRRKKDSSITKGAKDLKEGKINAFLSSGSTGALVAAGVFIAKRIEGIERPALPTFISSPIKGTLSIFLDMGANIECKPQHLVDYANMANIYAKTMFDIKEPKIALLNIGTEAKKGNQLYQETYKALELENLNFVGNLEPRDLLTTTNDIVVMDGFTGNMVLKTVEGNLSFFGNSLKQIYMTNIFTKISALFVKKKLDVFKKQFDYTEIGGTPIFGIQELIIKAHGSSNELALYNAIVKANDMIDRDFISQIKKG